jgi:hypothetical protein
VTSDRCRKARVPCEAVYICLCLLFRQAVSLSTVPFSKPTYVAWPSCLSPLLQHRIAHPFFQSGSSSGSGNAAALQPDAVGTGGDVPPPSSNRAGSAAGLTGSDPETATSDV